MTQFLACENCWKPGQGNDLELLCTADQGVIVGDKCARCGTGKMRLILDTEIGNISVHVEEPLLKGMANPSAVITATLNHAIRELKNKFPDYGNSYLNGGLGFWEERLSNEVEEFKKATTTAQKKRKVVNIFNIAWMAYGECLGVERRFGSE